MTAEGDGAELVRTEAVKSAVVQTIVPVLEKCKERHEVFGVVLSFDEVRDGEAGAGGIWGLGERGRLGVSRTNGHSWTMGGISFWDKNSLDVRL